MTGRLVRGLGCVLPFLSLLSGCVLPAAGHYYFPKAPNGVAVGEYCKNSVGPKNTLKLMLGSAKLLISAVKAGDSVVHIAMRITGGQVVIEQSAFDGMDVYVADNGSHLNKVNVNEIPLGIGYIYSFDVKAVPKKFTVRLPMIKVAEKDYPGVTVTFAYKGGVWATVPNC